MLFSRSDPFQALFDLQRSLESSACCQSRGRGGICYAVFDTCSGEVGMPRKKGK